ncbi:MAG: M23 family metallopeptidase [Microbacterium sp.]
MTEAVVLDLPFRGRWLARNSPARRIPSHGAHLFGTTYAIDFVAVDERGRSAPGTWRAAFATEAPEDFIGFGAPILAPIAGVVVATHDGTPDHRGRRSQLALVPYLLGQAARAREGGPALAGNHVVIDAGGARFVLLAHLQHGSVRSMIGERVAPGDVVGLCGNSGNSTQPHVHVQATDRPPGPDALGVPLAFRRRDGGGAWMPGESEIVVA